jgi:hypothetical protein
MPILRLDGGEPARPWFVSARLRNDGQRTAIDYWWAFEDNRSPTVLEAACLPVLAVLHWTCFDHDGDLEGVTVVLRGGRPIEVDYAAHSSLIRVRWDVLGGLGSVVAERPVVFVARKSRVLPDAVCSGLSSADGRSVRDRG